LYDIKSYYEMALLEIKRIENILEDGSVARDINRDEIMQEAKNRQNRYEQTKGNFFNTLTNAVQTAGSYAGQGLGFLANQLNSKTQPTNKPPQGNPQPGYPQQGYPQQGYPQQPPNPYNMPYGTNLFATAYPQFPNQPYPNQPPNPNIPPGWNQQGNFGGYSRGY
jgi:hypothetical protein